MIQILFSIPLVLTIFILLARKSWINDWANTVYAFVLAGFCLAQLRGYDSLSPYFSVDSTNVIFLLILTVVYFGVAIYVRDFLRRTEYTLEEKRLFSVFMMLFVECMLAAILSTHLVVSWVFVEATTLTGSYLIFINKTRAALEAAWKYIFICSIGIALSFIGIILFSGAAGPHGSLYYYDLINHPLPINPTILRVAFVFLLVGFGTKMGLAPVHSWLPDAHAEAPSPVSALLSGVLLNVAFLVILRCYRVMGVYYQLENIKILFIVMGFISLLVSAVFIGRTMNYKRMLAYSSIENMGIIAIGLGAGGIGVYAAILHMLGHSLAKSGLFLSSGNLIAITGSKKISDVSGILSQDAKTGWLWLLLFSALMGLPPSPVFFSELIMVKALLEQGLWWLVLLLFFYLLIVFYSLTKKVLLMMLSQPQQRYDASVLGWPSYLPQMLFLALLWLLGLIIPSPLHHILSLGSYM